MKTHKILTTAALALAAQIGIAGAATTLIDYDDGTLGGGHDAAVLNGGMESFTPAEALLDDWVPTGAATPLTSATGHASPAAAGGGRNTAIGGPGAAPTRYAGLDTGYTIALGDQFTASYWWKDVFRWNDGNDNLDMSLFYTDTNAIGGTRTVLESFTSALSGGNNAYQQETFGLTTALTDVGAVGKTLFVDFQGLTGNGFARLDGVYLDVTSVPEPSTGALLGLGGLALILRRRK